jgi:ubiquinone/menaquinone biosynthesis C-methylase UbiE
MYSKYWDSSRDDFSDRPSILFQDEHLNYLDDCYNIIDLGCGNGTLVQKLITQGKNAKGLTYNALEVDDAWNKRQLGKDDIYLGDMQNIPFEDDRFDAFVMWDSLEHCPSAYIALCEAKRVLKDYGKGLIFMPGQNWLDCHCHICCYTVPQMIQLCKQAGLVISSIFEKKYPDNPNKECEGMAIYYLRKDPAYKAVFAL